MQIKTMRRRWRLLHAALFFLAAVSLVVPIMAQPEDLRQQQEKTRDLNLRRDLRRVLSTEHDPLVRELLRDLMRREGDLMTLSEQFAPTRMPDRISLTWNDNPATTQAVTWRTDTQEDYGFAQISKATDGPYFWQATIPAKTSTLETDVGKAHYHTAEFKNLKPNTLYMYRIGDGLNWSEWFQFRTASDENDPFKFVYFGDWQNDIRSQASRLARQAFSDAPDARFWVYAGDMIHRTHEDGDWGEFFYAHGFINGMIPKFPVPGNHEHSPEGTICIHWRPQFNLPLNGPEGAEELVYYMDYQGVRFISLDSSMQRYETQKLQKEPGGDADHTTSITKWLEEVLKNNDQNWTIVIMHHPRYNPWVRRFPHRDDSRRDQWKPLFDKYQVDLVLQGHRHHYHRTGRVTYEHQAGEDFFDPDSGTVYVVSMAGPWRGPKRSEDWMARAAHDLQLYHVIHVDSDSIRFEATTAAGRLFDAFSIHKRPGQPNEIIERIPEDFEEHRFPKSCPNGYQCPALHPTRGYLLHPCECGAEMTSSGSVE